MSNDETQRQATIEAVVKAQIAARVAQAKVAATLARLAEARRGR